MDPKSDLLQVALEWLGMRGLLGLFLATLMTVLRALLGFDETRRQQALSSPRRSSSSASWHRARRSFSHSARNAVR